MPLAREQWSRLDGDVKIESPRKTFKFPILFVSPVGMFVPTPQPVDLRTQVTVKFKVENQAVVAHAEVRRLLTAKDTLERGISHDQGGWELRIVRMEGDGSQILAEHIKKILLESGGPR
ncbi:MAG TPA: PilZ domain-containing protein [Myxococcota bacterium]|nr:PilZ domain-containing protein [Myxococcota bacterium]HRY95098.1 PilZ domain-containing protein [Myxococcota bacterium]HSA23266.1 PilZ domain-containing protein [Myxococcota bacterium]